MDRQTAGWLRAQSGISVRMNASASSGTAVTRLSASSSERGSHLESGLPERKTASVARALFGLHPFFQYPYFTMMNQTSRVRDSERAASVGMALVLAFFVSLVSLPVIADGDVFPVGRWLGTATIRLERIGEPALMADMGGPVMSEEFDTNLILILETDDSGSLNGTLTIAADGYDATVGEGDTLQIIGIMDGELTTLRAIPGSTMGDAENVSITLHLFRDGSGLIGTGTSSVLFYEDGTPLIAATMHIQDLVLTRSSPLDDMTDAVVSFPDPELEAAIRDAIGKPSGDICDTDLIGLTSLGEHERAISNLEGIQYCADLTNLSLGTFSNRKIVDISPLRALSNLTSLSLMGYQIGSISPLVDLTNLTVLSLIGSEIVDIGPIASLTNLIWLFLNDNEIVNVMPLSNLSNLEMLELDTNSIIDISPLAGLDNLTKLHLGSNEIVDISSLARLTNLTKLYMRENKIVDVTPLVDLTKLEEVSLSENQIVNIEALSGLSRLTTLDLNENEVADLASLSGLTNLEVVRLSGNQIVEIAPLSNLARLELVDLSGNRIVDISPLSGLSSLTEIYLNGNEIIDLQAVVANLGLGEGPGERTRVDIRYNYLDLDLTPNSPDMQAIEDLADRGVNIDYDPQDSVLESAVVISFPDARLEETIRDVIGKPTRDIYDTDLARLTNLSIISAGIVNLEGIQFCTNLTSLAVFGFIFDETAQPIDLSPLAALHNLELLSLDSFKIVDLSPLAGLSGLTSLSLESLRIVDVRSLSGLMNLTKLDLIDNQIIDISPLSNLINLRELWLDSNQIVNFGSLSNLVNLRALWLDSNGIASLSALSDMLSNLTNFTELTLNHNTIVDIGPLASLSNLTLLWLVGNQISDVAPLATLTSLSALALGDNVIADIGPLSGLVQLTNLYLGRNDITDIRALVDNPGLGTGVYIEMTYNPLDLVSDSSDMLNIRTLQDRGVEIDYRWGD